MSVENLSSNNNRSRIWSLDILKIICAGLIFLRHANSMGGCSFGIFNTLILNTTSPIMTTFFIVSGMTLFYQNSKKELNDRKSILDFYKKRLIVILPAYLCINIIAAIFGNYSLQEILVLQPVEILGIQTWYDTLFGIFHNGGTWFVSAMLVSYFIYPILNQVIKKSGFRFVLIVFLIMVFINTYSQIVNSTFLLNDNMYSSPLFRATQFTIGVCLAKIIEFFSSHYEKQRAWISVLLFTVSGILLLCQYSQIITANWISYFDYLLISIFVFSVSLFVIKPGKVLRKIISEMAGLCYDVYLVQCVIWTFFFFILSNVPVIAEHNVYRLLTALLLLVMLSCILHYLIEKPIQKILRKTLLKNS